MPVAYNGMLGPRQRTERLVRNLSAAAPLDEARIYGPVGLDIGTDGAEQVALSVIAEILAVRSGRRARSLRERAAPIHAPADRSEEHTSELQSRLHLVCRLLLEKKKKMIKQLN